MNVKGRLVVVSGASRGIGAATAKLLALEGARVALIARSELDLRAVALHIHERGGEAHVFPADLSDANATTKICAEILSKLGTPSLLINNAGAGRWLFVEETPPGEEDFMIALPYLAAFRMTRGLLPSMLEAGTGMVLNVNSPVSVLPWSGATGYAAARWALRGFSESLRADLRGTGLRVCEVVLGETDSNYFDANPGSRDRLPAISKLLPVLTPDDAARHVARAVRRNKSRYTAPFLLTMTRWMLGLMPGVVRWVVQAGDMKHPRAK